MFKLVVPLAGLVLSACATPHYTTHYGVFEAQNSAGQIRMFRVSWQTVRYQGWGEDRYQSLPLILETQCSERKLYFTDASMAKIEPAKAQATEQGTISGERLAHACVIANGGRGVHYCADAKRDESRTGLPVDTSQSCGYITDVAGSQSILNLAGELRISLACQPKVKEYPRANKRVNSDYLKASSQPYIVKTRAVEGSSREALLPELSEHSSICQPDY